MKTIALIDHHTIGHHLAFIRLFAKYFLKLGYRVCIVYPEKSDEIKKYLNDEGFDDNLVLVEEGSVQRKMIPGNAIWKLPLATWHMWRDTNRLLKQVERKHHLKFDFVFLAWLDDYLCNYLHHFFIDITFPYRWSGLYFHPWYLNSKNINDRVSFSSVDSVLRSKNCGSVAIHDEFNLEMLQKRIKKKVVLFPEIADSTEPEQNYALAEGIRSEANGRTVVGLVGVSHRKGFLTFIETVRRSDSNKFFFFFSGPLEMDQLSITEIESIRRFINNPPSNCLYYPNYLDEGAKLNSVINAFDILFLVYNDFQSSSNFITKAAIFKKLVLSTERFWMGRVTQKYLLGMISPEGNAEKATSCLESIQKNKQEMAEKAKWSEYLNVHDEKNLLSAMQQVFE